MIEQEPLMSVTAYLVATGVSKVFRECLRACSIWKSERSLSSDHKRERKIGGERKQEKKGENEKEKKRERL